VIAAAAAGPPSSRPPQPLPARDAEAMAGAMATYHAQFHDLFVRREQREWSAFYLRGQLSDLERKTIEPMVLGLKPHAGDDRAAVRAVQQFLGEGAWDDARILERLETLVAEALGAPDGVLIVDGSGFPKQGTHSVGVARQYCGHVGKIANCQHGVFLAYASAKDGAVGCTFVDRRLYMPEAWFDEAHATARARGGVPADLRFATEPALGLAMVRRAVERGALPVRWVLADETYGADPKFLDGVAVLGTWYFVEVPVSTRVWAGTVPVEPPGQGPRGRPRTRARAAVGTPKPQEVRDLAAALPASAWRRYPIKAGAKGEIAADFAFLRVTRTRRGGRPGPEGWAVFRRGLGDAPETKVFLTNAPAGCPKRELARVSGMRWPVEVAFAEAKGEVGMDHYEVRTWRGWHHHMTQTFLAHHFLTWVRRRGEKPGPDARANQAARGRPPAGTGDADPRPRARHRAVPPGAELRRVPLTRHPHRHPPRAAMAADN